jgi:hypothetical protein
MKVRDSRMSLILECPYDLHFVPSVRNRQYWRVLYEGNLKQKIADSDQTQAGGSAGTRSVDELGERCI